MEKRCSRAVDNCKDFDELIIYLLEMKRDIVSLALIFQRILRREMVH
jgi:hypothetical protein